MKTHSSLKRAAPLNEPSLCVRTVHSGLLGNSLWSRCSAPAAGGWKQPRNAGLAPPANWGPGALSKGFPLAEQPGLCRGRPGTFR